MTRFLSFFFKKHKIRIAFAMILVLLNFLIPIEVFPSDGLTGTKIKISDANSSISINSGGNYILSGSADECSVTVDAGSDANVELILNGINISTTENAPIYIKSAASVTITLAEGTENYINDDREEKSDETATAAIFSKADLTITGTGSLSINAGMNDAVKSKDSLTIAAGTISINSIDDGLIGRDSLEIDGGEIYINAGGDAMKTTNDESSGSGTFIMNGGTVTAIAGNKGIASIYSVEINDGELTIDASNEGIEGQYITINDGTIDITAKDDGINISEKNSSSEEESTENNDKEMAPPDSNEISGNRSPGGRGGMRGGNGGMQKNSVSGPNASASANKMRPGGGIGGGMPSGGMAGGMGGEFETIDGALTINGGSITVNAEGDGLDSNGNIYITGGYTYVSGSSNGGNAALDYNGDCEMTGGVLILAGSSGMAQNVSEDSSTVTMLSAEISEGLEAGDTIEIIDEDGNSLYSFEIAKTCSYLQAAVPEFSEEGNYSFTVNGGNTYEATISSHTGF